MSKKQDEICLSTFSDNQQNHGSYLSATAGTIVALVVGWSLSINYPVVGFIILLVTSGTLLFLTFWLRLRSIYWSYWYQHALLLTDEKIVNGFNDWNNKSHVYYFTSEKPSCPAILHIAIMKHVCDNYSALHWRHSWHQFERKLAILTGLRNTLKLRNLKSTS